MSIDELVERTRREQGLPRRVEDEAALKRIAGLLRPADDVQQQLAS